MLTQRDGKLFAALMAWALLPSIYLLMRMHIVAINEVDINVLGQMEWFDLIDEVLVTTLTIPLYSLLRPKDAGGSGETNAAVFFVSLGIYAAFTVLTAFHISDITGYMNARGAEPYLVLQAVSMLVGFAATYGVLLLTVNCDGRSVHCLTLIRLVALVCFDVVLISKYGDIGAAYSELAANTVSTCVGLLLCSMRRYLLLPKFAQRNIFAIWIKRGIFVGLQIFLDNFIYAVMICKMVNAVNESGNYWIANNFIWGWLLVPVLCFTEIIRKNNLEKLDMRNTWRFAIGIAVVWMLSTPLWGWFIRSAMAIANADAVLHIVYPSAQFYLAYIPSALIDGWFVSKGKTWCLAVISAVVNLVYYGCLYIGFCNGAFALSVSFIIQMFGWGMMVHLLFSAVLYVAVQHGIAHNRVEARTKA